MTNPGNIVRVRSRNGGHASVYETNLWAQVWSSGLFQGNGVIQNTSPDMNVLVGGTPSSPDVVLGVNPSGYKIALDLIGQQLLAITAPASNSRIASVVAYTNDLTLQSTDTSTTGSPSSCGLIVVYGTTSASPVAPTDSQIRTAITADGATGSQAVYGVIAQIPVTSTTTSITNAIISKTRSVITSDKLNFGGSGSGIWWEEIARTKLAVSGDTISVTGIPARKYLKFKVLTSSTGTFNIGMLIRFNNDSGNNYAYKIIDNNTSASSVTSQSSLGITAASAINSIVGNLEILDNVANLEKGYTSDFILNVGNTGAVAIVRTERTGKWANTTDQITRIDVINNGSDDFAVGSEVVVLGHD